jgi:hypothetical protein
VTGATSLSTLTTSGLATLDSLGVTNNATVGGTLGVTGATSLSTLTTSGLATLNSLGVTNNATVGGTLGVTGATSLSTLTTSGLASLNSLGVTNNATVGGTLGVTGATSLSTLTTSGLATLNSLGVTNNATVGGTLGVTGLLTASNGLTVTSGNITLSPFTTAGVVHNNASGVFSSSLIVFADIGANGCIADQIIKRNPGNTAWVCAPDLTGAITSTIIMPTLTADPALPPAGSVSLYILDTATSCELKSLTSTGISTVVKSGLAGSTTTSCP